MNYLDAIAIACVRFIIIASCVSIGAYLLFCSWLTIRNIISDAWWVRQFKVHHEPFLRWYLERWRGSAGGRPQRRPRGKWVAVPNPKSFLRWVFGRGGGV